MRKYYYGLWQNFYHVSWPVRFFIELVVLISIIKILIKILTGKKIRLNIRLAKLWTWIVTEFIYFVGRGKKWAVEIDHKMLDWVDRVAKEEKQKKRSVLIYCIWIGIIIIYFIAIFVDLPFSKNLHNSYLSGFANMKTFFQGCEQTMSKGYENYPPLFVKKEAEVLEEEVEEKSEVAEQELFYIKLNTKGKNGSNIRESPSLDGKVVGGVNGEAEILYKNQWENDGERYWLKIYLVKDEIEGWISGNLIDKDQLEEIINCSSD